MNDFHTVCRADEVREGQAKAVHVGNKLIAVFRDGGRFYALDDTCPHMGASLSGGEVANGIVTCPWHAWRFRLSDGAWADAPRVRTGCYEVRIEGDEIQIRVPAPPPRPQPQEK